MMNDVEKSLYPHLTEDEFKVISQRRNMESVEISLKDAILRAQSALGLFKSNKAMVQSFIDRVIERESELTSYEKSFLGLK